MSQFSDNVKSLMLQKGISQTDLCLRTDIGKSNLSEYKTTVIDINIKNRSIKL